MNKEQINNNKNSIIKRIKNIIENKSLSTKKRRLVIGVCLALILLCFIFIFGLLVSGGEEVKIKVNRGDGTIIIADRLKEAGLIKEKTLFRVYATLSGNGNDWKPGNYVVKRGMGYIELCRTLTSVEGAIKVVIPEGKQVSQMATLLQKKGICNKKEFLKACHNHKFNYKFLKGVNQQKRINGLEGYLFPSTYYFNKGEDVDVVIDTMLKAFEENVYTKEFIKVCKKKGYTTDEMIILASIVESEATTEKDRRRVAGVFYNRLGKTHRARLGSCVTVEYAKRMKKAVITYSDTKYNSPYNTYLYGGLPYGPISCPGMESINAVLNPEKNKYKYFQSDSHGKLWFAETFEEHLNMQTRIHKYWKNSHKKINNDE